MGVKWPISHIWWSSSPLFHLFSAHSCVADRKHCCSGTINVPSMNLFHNFFVASILIIPGSLIPTFFVKLSLAKWTSYHLPSEPLGGPLPTFELSVGRTGSVRKSPLTWHKIQNDQVIRGWTSLNISTSDRQRSNGFRSIAKWVLVKIVINWLV